MGSIRKRGDVYCIRYYDRHGRQREESARTSDYEAAKTLLREREGALAKGVPVTPKIHAWTFENGVQLIKTDYALNERDSWSDVARRIRLHLQPWFGGKRMAGITSAEWRAYQQARKQDGASNAQINREQAALLRMFNLARADGLLVHVPKLGRLQERPARQGFFERDEFDAIVAQLPADLHPLAIAAYVTGWRLKAELLPLEWSHIDRRAEEIRLPAAFAKNDEGRVFPYGRVPELAQALAACWAHHEALAAAHRISPRVFVRATGAPINSWRGAWTRARTAAELPHRLVHDFRRTAVRNLIRGGVAQKIAMAMVGHKTVEMFSRYNIVDADDVRQAAARYGAYLDAERAANTATQGKKQGKIRVFGPIDAPVRKSQKRGTS